MKQVILITDGSCIGNPGPGGWAFILRYAEYSKEQAGGCAETTNNRMEIQALIEGLKALKEPCELLLISDSQYVLNGVTNWRYKWSANGWMRKRRRKTYPLANADLWRDLDEQAEKHTICGQWVKGHSGHPDNERCDLLASVQAAQFRDALSFAGLAA